MNTRTLMMPALLVLLLAPASGATTVTSGRIVGASDGSAPPFGWAAAVRKSTVARFPPGASLWPDLLVDLDSLGRYRFDLDENDPSWHTFYLFSLSPVHLNQIYAGVSGSYALPYPEDFQQPGVVTFSSAQDNTGKSFLLDSNKSTEMVLMRDGVTHLATDCYRARAGAGDATILARTPYGKDGLSSASLYTLFGFSLVAQDSRGRFASEGVDPVFRDDAWGADQDGWDTVEWVAAQSFSNGKVGMLGGSALGITQYLTAGAAPPHLVCGHATVGTGNLYDGLFFTGGIFRKADIETWLAGQGSSFFLADLEAHPDRDAWWDEVDIVERRAEIDAPMFHVGGWFDLMQEGATRGFHDLQHQGGPGARGNQKLLIGPWTHGTGFQQQQGELVFPPNATSDGGFSDAFAFLSYWLKGIDTGIYQQAAVRYYVMGDVDDPHAPGNVWRDADDWPPPATATRYFLRADGTLAPESQSTARVGRLIAPAGGAVSYAYDPANPAPTVGGSNLVLPAGPYDQRAVEARPDVVTFTTGVLAQPLEVTGHLSARLFVASTARDTDFMVKLTDVYPDGRSMLIQEGAIRARHRISDRREDLLVPGVTYVLDVDLWSTSIVFNVGHRVRISMTSSNDPRYDPNPNTGEPFRQNTHTEIATNTIYCSGDRASYVVLPIKR